MLDIMFGDYLDLSKKLYEGQETEIHGFIKERINTYKPNKKNTDFIITDAFIQTLKKYPELVQEKTTILTQPIGFSDGIANDYTIELLSKYDLINGMPMVLGSITPCCLNFGATGGNFSLYSIFEPNANFAVVKHNGKIISHALIWMDEKTNVLVIDSIDPINKALENETNKILLEQNGNLLINLYNELAQQLKYDNNLDDVVMSLGGNTLNALKLKEDTQKYKSKLEQLKSLEDKIKSFTGWNDLSSDKYIPKNGKAFFMDDFDIHESTYQCQISMNLK